MRGALRQRNEGKTSQNQCETPCHDGSLLDKYSGSDGQRGATTSRTPADPGCKRPAYGVVYRPSVLTVQAICRDPFESAALRLVTIPAGRTHGPRPGSIP